MSWTDLSVPEAGSPPTNRSNHGFTSSGGKLYVHAGYGLFGEDAADGSGTDVPRDSLRVVIALDDKS